MPVGGVVVGGVDVDCWVGAGVAGWGGGVVGGCLICGLGLVGWCGVVVGGCLIGGSVVGVVGVGCVVDAGVVGFVSGMVIQAGRLSTLRRLVVVVSVGGGGGWSGVVDGFSSVMGNVLCSLRARNV